MSRIVPLAPPYRHDVADLLAGMMPPGVAPIGLFRAFARNMPMATAMGQWGRYELGRDLSLTTRDREIVIDRTCARCGCEYEWGVHVQFFAERAGLGPAQVRSLTHGAPSDPCWTDGRERLLIAAVDALHDDADIPDALWAELASTFADEQLLDLLLLTGWYHAISYVARAGRIPNEPGAPTFAGAAESPGTAPA